MYAERRRFGDTLNVSLRLPGACAVTVRLMEPHETGALQSYIRSLSPQSRRNRFLGALNELSTAELNRLGRLDPAQQAVLLAEIEIGGARKIIAEARYALLLEGTQCEIALSVTDHRQRQGLGTLLLEILERRASDLGAHSVIAEALHSNEAVKGLFRKAGFIIRSDIEDASLVRMAKVIRPLATSHDRWPQQGILVPHQST
jgi:acetyltransferase